MSKELGYYVNEVIKRLKQLQAHPVDCYNKGLCRTTLHEVEDLIEDDHGESSCKGVSLYSGLWDLWLRGVYSWEYFSGVGSYPIADPQGALTPYRYYHREDIDKWEEGSKQLELRLSLIDHMVDTLEEHVDVTDNTENA